MWRMGISNSYTMEVAFGGSTLGEGPPWARVDDVGGVSGQAVLGLGSCCLFCSSLFPPGGRSSHFTVEDLKSLGYHLCDTLLDFCDPHPAKVGQQPWLKLRHPGWSWCHRGAAVTLAPSCSSSSACQRWMRCCGSGWAGSQAPAGAGATSPPQSSSPGTSWPHCSTEPRSARRGCRWSSPPHSTSGSDSSVSDGPPARLHGPARPVSPWVLLLLGREGQSAREARGAWGCRRPGTTLPPGTAGATEEEASAEPESEECPAPDKCCLPEPCQHPGEPGPMNTIHLVPEGTVLQGHLVANAVPAWCQHPCSSNWVQPLFCVPPGQAGTLHDPQAASSPRRPQGRQRRRRGAWSWLQRDLSQHRWSGRWPPRHHGEGSAGRWHEHSATPPAAAEHPPPPCHW